MAIPQTQIAAILPQLGPSADAQVQIINTHPVPAPGEGDVLIKLEYSGVCHSDVHSIYGDTPMLTDVAGHEGVGRVVQGEYAQSCTRWYPDMVLFLVGLKVGKQWMGKRVGVRLVLALLYVQRDVLNIHRWLYSSCLDCEICAVNHTACPYQKNAGAVGLQPIGITICLTG